MVVFDQIESVIDMDSFVLFLNALARDYKDNLDDDLKELAKIFYAGKIYE